ncbi:beta-galactosidase [Geopyxis carbonaria]|nr:beta-galactosidase [Geopyxis carbonaria]
MKFSSLLCFAGLLAGTASATNSSSVTFDHYSLSINGERSLIWAGEFHYWRIPVPELWRDILEKFKAHGFNTVSIYGHWGFHSAAPGVLDFSTPTHDPRPIMTLAKEIGLWVIFRPGPYVNAESHSGGHAQYVTNGRYGDLRNNDTRYVEAWKPYMKKYWEILQGEQVDTGGNMIAAQLENEFWSMAPESIDYMRQLKEQALEEGITVPLTHNNPNMESKAWSTEYKPNAGSVDISGFDSYPYCWSCVLSECGGRKEYSVVEYYDYFTEVSPNQPPYIPEFQGGSYSPWGSPEGNCITKQNSEFVNIMYRHNIGERLTMISIYVFFGGTNWGNIGYSPAVTSYDYSAAISESRLLQEKYKEGKSLGLFLNVARAEIAKTDRLYYDTGLTTNANLKTSLLVNPDTKARFYVVRHDLSSSTTVETFKINMTTSEGVLTVPSKDSATLAGLTTKILLSDFTFAPKHTLLYSTTEVLTSSIVDGKPVLVFWTPNGESAEFALKDTKSTVSKKTTQLCKGCAVSFDKTAKGSLIVRFDQEAGISIVDLPDLRIVLVDRGIAWGTYVPKLSPHPDAAGKDNVIVHGAHLVRSVKIGGRTIHLTGDTPDATTLLIHAPAAVKSLTWNGRSLSAHRTPAGLLSATLAAPKLTAEAVEAQLNKPGAGWQSIDTLPESAAAYDDSHWTLANLTSTSIKPPPLTLPVLYAEDYNFFHGAVHFRGHFTASPSGTPTSVSLGARFGNAGGISAWLNGHYIGSSHASTADSWNGSFALPAARVRAGKNVLTVLLDHTGKDQSIETIKNYRGLHTARLDAGAFSAWRIQGTQGGIANLDPVRGPYNEGGLYAERRGLHLPGAPLPRSAKTVTRLAVAKPGEVRFFRKTLKLDVPAGFDVPVAVRLTAPGKKVRVQLWVNGYQFGRFIPEVGNQEVFPVPPGVLNYGGENVVAVSVWNQDSAEVELGLRWEVLGVYESSMGSRGIEGRGLRTAWSSRGREK